MAVGTETKKSLVLVGDLADRLQALADGEHRSFANMVEFILQRYLAQASKPESPSMASPPIIGGRSKSV